ncbi:MAG TPA: uroporphyrinogen-III synthase [Candidatus Acidoferrales bacterium]
MSGEHKPLSGKSVVVTRAAEQARELIARLESFGAEVLLLPTVSFADPEDTVILDATLRSLERIDWILFTSENAVKYFARRARSLGIVLGERRGGTKVGAVGPMTAAAAAAEGLAVDYVAKRHNAEALAQELRGELAGKRVLLPHSDLAKDDLARLLGECAGQVIEVVAYRTIAPGSETAVPTGRIRGTEDSVDPAAAALRRIRSGNVDAISFASPSAFRNFAELVGTDVMRALSESAKFAAIGPTTARAIREDGWNVAIESSESTSDGLGDAVAAYFEKEASGVKS